MHKPILRAADRNSSSPSTILQATRAYEGNRDVLASITSINSSTNAVISGSDYAVNAIGQRTGITRSGSATPGSASAGYTYNNRGELITADEATNAMDRAYQYDGIGNREKSANSLTLPGSNNFTVNALNQYTAVNLGTSVSPVHDDDGNATAYPLPVNLAANAALTYDGENRLIKVITGSTTVEYIYDAFSRRVAKTVGSTRTYYIYDGWNCVAEFTGAVHTSGTAPALTRTFTHTWGLDLSGSMQGAGGVGGLLQTTAHGSLPTHHYPLYDGNGNITAYIDNACAVQASFDYDPFGNIANSNNPHALPYAFSTKPRESETGLYYYGYRFYDPAAGRWINRDPIEEEGGVNMYGFVENGSTYKSDFLGNIDVAKCCQRIKNIIDRIYGKGYGPHGIAACCDGAPVACSLYWLDDDGGIMDFTEKIIGECITEHEVFHANRFSITTREYGKCPCSGTIGIVFTEYTNHHVYHGEECEANKFTYKCLKKKLAVCNSLGSETQKGFCKREVEDKMLSSKINYEKHCGWMGQNTFYGP
jgi:RHS repeat-associated protein